VRRHAVGAGYTAHHQAPGVEDYRRLRGICGLTPRNVTAAEAGLPNTLFAVIIRQTGQTIGMGRNVGDGALFFHIVDIAVDPDHQGQGLGKVVMAMLMEHIKATAPAEAHVSLMADGDAPRLYAQFGFEPVAPRSLGMAVWINKQCRRLPSSSTCSTQSSQGWPILLDSPILMRS